MPRSASRSLLSFTAAGLAVLLTSAEARAYCLTSACPGDVPGQICNPPSAADCGVPLFWNPACFGVAVQREASSQIDLASAESLVAQAFGAWENADCGSGDNPAIHVELFEAVTCDEQEYNQRGGNVNLVVFRDTEWPYVGAGNTLALTTVTYNLDTGEIFDADLEVNSTSNIKLTTADAGAEYDILSILTHEAGHMLGVAHSANPEATMKVEYEPGNLELRTLHPDDVAAICVAYPPPDLESCDPTPRHGFKETCGPGPVEEEGCALSATAGSEGDPAWLVPSLIALVAVRLRSSSRRSQKRERP